MSLRHWTLGDWWLAAMALYALITGAGAWLHGRYRYHTGWEDGRDYQKSRDINARLRDRSRDNPAIRAKTGPLAVSAPARALRPPEPRRPQRIVTTAADIAPVIYPVPGTSIPVRPQPAADPARRTAAMAALTDTGWMRAIEDGTNEYIHQMHEDSARYDRLRARDAASPRPDGPAPAPAQGAGPLDRPQTP